MSDGAAELPPSPLEHWYRFTTGVGRNPWIFLDFDGTLAPIVERPEDAAIPDATRRTVERLAETAPVAVISGRGLDDVMARVGLPELYYAGSHGFEIRSPSHEGPGAEHRFGEEFIPLVEEATRRLEADLAGIPGAQVEPKRYTVAVHDRRVAEADRPRVKEAVDREVARQPRLTLHGGKRVHEIRPEIDWNKGRAVRWLLEHLEVDPAETLPLYVGDDVTDEDAFAALEELGGVGIVILDEPRPTRASWAVEDPTQVRRLLERLADHLS